jgi:hypothetical protein
MPSPDTRERLGQTLHDYGAGLRAELSFLHQVDELSKRQRQASQDGLLETLGRIAEEREVLAGSLVELEHHLKPLRAVLAEHVTTLGALPAFQEVSQLHRDAAALVSAIMESDSDTLGALRSAEDVRRAAAHALEAGEATLAAYRRALSPGAGTAGLVDQVG